MRPARITMAVVLLTMTSTLHALPMQFSIRGGRRITDDHLNRMYTISGGGRSETYVIPLDNRGGYSVEAELADPNLGRWTPFATAGWSFDRSVVRNESAEQYLRSHGMLLLVGVTRSFGVIFANIVLSAGAGYDWETIEQSSPQIGIKGPQRSLVANHAPVAAGAVGLDLPLFGGIWTTFGYRLVYKFCPSQTVGDQYTGYVFSPQRSRHYLQIGLSFRPLSVGIAP